MLCSRRKRCYRDRRKKVDPVGHTVLQEFEGLWKIDENSLTESFSMTVDGMLFSRQI